MKHQLYYIAGVEGLDIHEDAKCPLEYYSNGEYLKQKPYYCHDPAPVGRLVVFDTVNASWLAKKSRGWLATPPRWYKPAYCYPGGRVPKAPKHLTGHWYCDDNPRVAVTRADAVKEYGRAYVDCVVDFYRFGYIHGVEHGKKFVAQKEYAKREYAERKKVVLGILRRLRPEEAWEAEHKLEGKGLRLSRIQSGGATLDWNTRYSFEDGWYAGFREGHRMGRAWMAYANFGCDYFFRKSIIHKSSRVYYEWPYGDKCDTWDDVVKERAEKLDPKLLKHL